MIEIIKKPHYEIRCPFCGCHFKFDLNDIKNLNYASADFVYWPNCAENSQVRDGKDYLLPIIKVSY